jgi:hypothetical protein
MCEISGRQKTIDCQPINFPNLPTLSNKKVNCLKSEIN